MYFPPLAPERTGRPRRAFTLIELLAVLAIVAILTGLVLGSGRRASDAAKIARAKGELAALAAGLESYQRQQGDYPRTDDNATLVQSLLGRLAPAGASLVPAGRMSIETARFSFALRAQAETETDPWTNPAANVVDPWGQPYRYAYKTATPWTNPSFILYSIGPDGVDTAALRAGGFTDTAAAANVDNLSAHRP